MSEITKAEKRDLARALATPEKKPLDFGKITVVDEDSLHWKTQYGFVLLDSYEIDVPSWQIDDGSGCKGHPPRRNPNSHCSGGKVDESPYFPVRQRRFIVGLSEEAWQKQLTDQEEKLIEWEQEIPNLAEKIAKLEAQLDARTKEALDADTRAREKRLECGGLRNEIEKLEDKIAKMETDLGKARDALGSVRWKEIINDV